MSKNIDGQRPHRSNNIDGQRSHRSKNVIPGDVLLAVDGTPVTGVAYEHVVGAEFFFFVCIFRKNPSTLPSPYNPQPCTVLV